ncbi:MAG: hypothetical protein AAGF12_35525 [Myxococcota bacterium]
MRTSASIMFVSVLAFLMACGDSEPEGTLEPEPEPAPGASASESEPEESTRTGAALGEEADGEEAEGEEAASVIDDPAFELRATAEGPFSSGELSQFAISLTPRGEWHVNEEFPISVELTVPEGIDVPKAELGQSDAAEFGEEAARFDVPFTPSATGEHEVSAKVSFAVCTPSNCIPDERTLALVLPVQ